MHNQTRRTLIRLNDNVRYLTVQRIANSQQLAQHFAWVRIAQQRTIAVARGTVYLLLHRRMQINDPAATTQSRTVFCTHDSTTTSSKNHAVQLAQLDNHRLLALTESRLALNIEDPGDIGSCALLDFLVGIFEGHP